MTIRIDPEQNEARALFDLVDPMDAAPSEARSLPGRMIKSRRMNRVEASHRYDVPVERGFVFITNTVNWSRFWPGYVRLEDGSRWGGSGDTARLVTRLFGRERELTMTIRTFEPNRLVTYTSTQPGLPDAYHERYFEPDGEDSSTDSSSTTSRVGGSPAYSTPRWSHAESDAHSNAPSPRWSRSSSAPTRRGSGWQRRPPVWAAHAASPR